MKKIWNLVAVMAVVNMLVVLGGTAWMWSTGRLDRERVKAFLAAPMVEAEPEPMDPGEPQPTSDGISTSVKIDAAERARRVEAMTSRRLQDEKAQLDRQLEERQARLALQSRNLQAERTAWDEAMVGVKASTTAEQFRKSVKLLESVPSKQAKDWILGMVREGKTAEAVDYLNAMTSFKASNLLKAFKGEEENKVATDLLDRLRRRTPDTRVATGSSDAASATSNANTSPAQPASAANNAVASPSNGQSGGQSSGGNIAAAGAGNGAGTGSVPIVAPTKPIANGGAEVPPPATR